MPTLGTPESWGTGATCPICPHPSSGWPYFSMDPYYINWLSLLFPILLILPYTHWIPMNLISPLQSRSSDRVLSSFPNCSGMQTYVQGCSRTLYLQTIIFFDILFFFLFVSNFQIVLDIQIFIFKSGINLIVDTWRIEMKNTYGAVQKRMEVTSNKKPWVLLVSLFVYAFISILLYSVSFEYVSRADTTPQPWSFPLLDKSTWQQGTLYL